MELIRLTSMKETGIDARYGTVQRAAFGLFQCPKCSTQLELKLSRGTKQKTCNKCKKVTHGKANTREYCTWRSMVQRCNNPNNAKFHIYGGKGIKVCDKWLTFEGFWEDNKDRYTDTMTIDRIDSSKGYDLENTRWISHSQNSSETSKRRPVNQFRAVLVPVKDWVLVQQWESAKAAADSLGLVAAHITATCKNDRKTHGGFSWQYADTI